MATILVNSKTRNLKVSVNSSTMMAANMKVILKTINTMVGDSLKMLMVTVTQVIFKMARERELVASNTRMEPSMKESSGTARNTAKEISFR